MIPGQAGKDVGYSRSGVFTKITDTCSADTQAAGNALAVEGDCKIDVGSDLVIWTKHFTTFATYTQTTSSSGGGGGGYSYSLSNLSVVINNNNANTNSRNVILTLTGTNAAQMMISNNSNFSGSTYESFTTSKPWTFSEEVGTKTVYVKFRNIYNVESAVFSDSIALVEGSVLGEATSGTHKDGTLILIDGTIYLMKSGVRQGFRDAQEFLSHGYKFSDVIEASEADKAVPTGSIIKAKDGILVIDASDNRTIYVIENGKKRGFVSWTVFAGLGYKFANAVKINLSDYEVGEPISILTNRHPDGTLIVANGTVWIIKEGQRYGFTSAELFNSYGYKFTHVVKANAADLELPEGPVMGIR